MHKTKLPEPGGVEKLQEDFRQFLIKQEKDLKPYIDGTAEDELRTMSSVTPELLDLCIDCLQNAGPANDDAQKGILHRKGLKTYYQGRWATLRPVRDRFDNPETEMIWKCLAMLRMMQLNLAGDEDWTNVWCKSLMYDAKRLFDLVFRSRDRTLGWETKTVRLRREVRCAACYSSGRSPAEIWDLDRVTVIPCSEGHMIHREDVATWFVGNQKHCPECDEVVL
jgi:hypothetical protein